ncbi:S-adenosyl-L-methionine-dependent methyltransferase [Pseudovirgaria hyperparasitica]|uniref:DNA (cytosine-5-)-methyltransferase n=1 Tax=Pseudovirgaria hyperparasitica TaxID=470096 RepID=A0A6A6VU88_9PEZI|nr:S-adenosyl-L-methionine-dependent methyltransferase [Pseudovirgaria hyperparasitica]KAF2753304.1 S-adenosyl-L-methionine-dependent methyltransferase [Pseudovirgaria hyperparasitica]
MPGFRHMSVQNGSADRPIDLDDVTATAQAFTGLELCDDLGDELEDTHFSANVPQTVQRNGPIQYPKISITNFRLDNGEIVVVNDCVEFQRMDSSDSVNESDFLKIHDIVFDTTESDGGAPPIVFFRGLRFRRSKHYRGIVTTAWLNEVFCDMDIDINDPRPEEVQGQIEVDARTVMKKRDLVITTRPYPLESWRHGDDAVYYRKNNNDDRHYITHFARLTARFTRINLYKNASQRQVQSVRPLGGSFRSILEIARTIVSQRSSYIFLDVFCGAGGASAGARAAGYTIMGGVDIDATKIESFKANFPSSQHYCMDVSEFIQRFAEQHKGQIDHVHMSPPCQYFSPAHTREGRHDDKNTAAIFSVGMLIKAIEPRIVTLEETAGLMNRHLDYFKSLVAQIHDSGYDVQWRRENLAEFGLPQQSRPRLLMVAVKHGATMPSWPAPTHGEAGSGLRTLVSIDQAIRGIPRGDSLSTHEPARNMPVADRSRGLRSCMTTSGPDANYDQHRQFTIREAACLQGFPMRHQFAGSKTEIRVQIGNAFPPVAAKALFLACIGVLKSRPDEEPAACLGGRNVIDLTSDDENTSPKKKRCLPVTPHRGNASSSQLMRGHDQDHFHISPPHRPESAPLDRTRTKRTGAKLSDAIIIGYD